MKKKHQNVTNDVSVETPEKYQIQVEGNTISLTGFIGWYENDDTLRNALDGQGDVEIHINSNGGAVKAGLAMYNIIKGHPGNVTGIVNGVAFSIAGYILQACNVRKVYNNSMFMLHNTRVPFTEGGDSNDFRKLADQLDKWTQAIKPAFSRSGKSDEELKTLMDEETYYVGEEIVTEGFADELIEDDLDFENVLNAFDPKTVSLIGGYMSKKIVNSIGVPDPANAGKTEPVAAKSTPEPVAVVDPVAEYVETQAAVRNVFKGHEGYQDLLIECLSDRNITVEAAQGKLLGALQSSTPEPQSGGAVVDNYGAKNTRQAMIDVLNHRNGVEKDNSKLEGNPFVGSTLLDMSRGVLNSHGTSINGMSKMEVVGAAFTHSSGDFPTLLVESTRRTLLATYNAQPATWRQWCDTGSLSDFKPTKRVRLGAFSRLDLLPEGSEYQYGTMGESYEQTQLETKGRAISFTRQAIINDDLSAFSRTASALGRAAARSINADAYTLLTSNPTLVDGDNVFHANRGNIGTAGLPSLTTLKEAHGIFRTMKTGGVTDEEEFVDVMPAILLVPVAQEIDTRVLMASTTDPSQANSRKPNPFQNAYAVISDPYLDKASTTGWYLFPSPTDIPVVEVSFLDGNQTPFLDTMEGFDIDGFKTKVRLDYVVSAVDDKAVYNAGA